MPAIPVAWSLLLQLVPFLSTEILIVSKLHAFMSSRYSYCEQSEYLAVLTNPVRGSESVRAVLDTTGSS